MHLHINVWRGMQKEKGPKGFQQRAQNTFKMANKKVQTFKRTANRKPAKLKCCQLTKNVE